MTINDVVRNRRHKIGYTQGDVERLTGISHQAYGCFERNVYSLSADRFVAICKLLRLKMSDFENCELRFSRKHNPGRSPKDRPKISPYNSNN